MYLMPYIPITFTVCESYNIMLSKIEEEGDSFMATAEPIRSKKHIKQLTEHYLRKGQIRNHVLVVMGIYTALRIGDLLRLKWGDVYDFKRQNFRSHIYLAEQKTGKRKTVALNKQATDALRLYFSVLDNKEQGVFLFQNNRKSRAAISRVQAYRIIKSAADDIGLIGRISCHSLRKTFGYHAWKSGAPVAVIMDIYNHSSLAVTRRYLGVCQDDRDKVYMNMQLT